MRVSDLEKRLAKAAREGKADPKYIALADDLPKPPAEYAHLLLWYFELRNANPRGWRFEPIAHSEIEAYGRLYDLGIMPHEVAELRHLDALWMSVQPEPERSK